MYIAKIKIRQKGSVTIKRLLCFFSDYKSALLFIYSIVTEFNPVSFV